MVLRLMPQWLPFEAGHSLPARERRRSADSTITPIADLPASPEDEARVRAQQIKAILSNTPVSTFASFINTILVLVAAWGEINQSLLIAWFTISVALIAITVMSWQRNRKRRIAYVSIHAVRKATMYAFVAALPWASLIPLFYASASSDLRVVIVAVSAGMACGGGISLSRVQPAAYVYLGTITLTTIATLLTIGGTTSTIMAFATLLYSVALTAMIRTMADLSVQHARAYVAIERQNQMIGFLLKDFEENASDWLWETNAVGEIIYCSDRMSDVTGLTHEDILGKSIAHWAAGGGEDEAWRGWDHHIKERQSFRSMMLPVQVLGEPRWWQITARPLYDEMRRFKGYRGVAADVTVLRAAESMRRAKEEAEEANEAKSRFLAVMSHELRTPLNSIIGFSELIAREHMGPVGTREYVNYAKIIMQSSHHLLEIINDVLSMARAEHQGESLNESTFLASELIEASLSYVGHAADNGKIELHNDAADDMTCVTGDVRQLRQLLLNLLTNAIKFTRCNGEIRVSTSFDAHGQFRIQVKDSGIGVPTDKLASIFEPFVQADDGLSRKAGGVGLGLSIAVGIARAHGGDLLFESEVGKGSVATLLLPANRIKETFEIDRAMVATG